MKTELLWKKCATKFIFTTLYNVAQMVRGLAHFNVNFGVQVNPPVPNPRFRSSLVLQLQLL